VRPWALAIPIIVGFAFGVGEPPGKHVLTFFTESIDAGLSGLIMACLLLLPLAGWAGVALWRDGYAASARGWPDLAAAVLGLSAAIGMTAGFKASFMSHIDRAPDPGAAPTILLLVAFFLWVRAGAYWWLASGTGRRLAVPVCWCGMVLGGFVLVAMWTKLAITHELLDNAQLPGATVPPFVLLGFVFQALTIPPTTTLFFVALWAYVALPRWIGLEPADRAVVLRRRLRQVLAWTLAYAALLIIGRIVAVQVFAPELRATADYKIWFFGVWLLAASLLQGGLALSMSLRRPQATVAEACCCALLAGLLMGFVTLAVNRAVGGGLELSFVVNTLCQFINNGAFAALPMAVLGSGLRFAAARFRPLPTRTVAVPPPKPGRAWPAAAAGPQMGETLR
jgi:hypothetical protein